MRNKRILMLLMLAIMILNFVITVYADNTYVKNAYDWIMDGIKLIVLGVIAFYAIKHLAKRQFMQFAGFAVLAAFVLVIVYGPDKLRTVGEYLWNIVFQ